MPLWGKSDKIINIPKFLSIDQNGKILSDSSEKRIVFLDKEEAKANSNKGASGAGWYSVLTINKGMVSERIRMELLVSISGDKQENIPFIQSQLYSNNASVYADGAKGISDPNNRDGWYFINNTANKKINWYFYDGSINNVSLGNLSVYAIATMDNASAGNAPFFGIYTTRQNDGLDAASWYRSRLVYVITTPFTVGTKYLIHTGNDPLIHPELPRLKLSLTPVAGINAGPKGPSERILTVSIGSNSASAVNTAKFVVQELGVNATNFKNQIELKNDASDIIETDAGLDQP